MKVFKTQTKNIFEIQLQILFDTHAIEFTAAVTYTYQQPKLTDAQMLAKVARERVHVAK